MQIISVRRKNIILFEKTLDADAMLENMILLKS
jgi:hypothetical protein